MQERLDDLNTKLNETVSGAREIKAFVTESHEVEMFDRVNDKYSATIVGAFKHIANIDPLIILISNIGIGAVCYSPVIWFQSYPEALVPKWLGQFLRIFPIYNKLSCL